MYTTSTSIVKLKIPDIKSSSSAFSSNNVKVHKLKFIEKIRQKDNNSQGTRP